MSSAYDIFVNSVIGPIVFTLGMIGNLLGLIVISREKLKDIGPIYIYRGLFISDAIYLPQIIVTYMVTQFNYDPTILSSISCKIYQYLNFVPDAISPWLLVYISVEKFVSIRFQAHRLLLRNKLNQTRYLVGLIMFCFIYYLIQPFCFDLIEINSGDNETTFIICSFKNAYLQRVSALVDTIHRVILPFTLMIVFSTLLVVFICESSKRVAGITKNSTDRRHKHDVKFAISSFSMNLLFILLNLPLSLMNLLIGTPLTTIYLTVYLFYFSYGVNFYVMFITNSIFRK